MRVGVEVSRNRLCLTLCLAAVLICQAGYVLSSPLRAGSAEFIKGEVSVEREGRQSALRQGDAILVQDLLRIGPEGYAEFVFADGSRVRLAENTSLEIVEYLYDPAVQIRQVLVSLVSGKARFAVQDFQEYDDKRFRVETPIAVIWSRDTDFIVSYQREAPTDAVCRGGLVEAFCLENSIIVFNNDFVDKPVVVIANMISRVCGRDLPTPPGFITLSERSSILDGFEQIGNEIALPAGSPRITGGPPPGAEQ
jgi:hypothetical protein